MSAARRDETLLRQSVDDDIVAARRSNSEDRQPIALGVFFFYLRQSHKFLRQTSTDKEFLTMLSAENFL